MPTRADVLDAWEGLRPVVRRTPVLELDGRELGVSGRVLLKLELLQHTGSFKPRGAYHALAARPDHDAEVVAASGGNHGAAVAWAAARLGRRATVFVPASSPPMKAARIRAHGADVHVVPGFYAEALEAAQEYAEARTTVAVHAFDQPAVVAGQGTTQLELLDQVPDATAVLVTVGGGGLAAGMTLAGGAPVVPVEPESCPTLHAAVVAGQPIDVTVGGVAADATGARCLGRIGFAVLGAIAPVQVTDDEILAAQAWLWERVRVLAEPGGAVALAAVLSGRWIPEPGACTVVLVCGGNTDALPPQVPS